LKRSGRRNVFGQKRKEIRGDFNVMMRSFRVCSRLKILLG